MNLYMLNRTWLKVAMLGLVAAGLAGAPLQTTAQTTNKAPAEKKSSDTKKASAHSIHGKLAAMDKAAKTVTVGKTTYQVAPGAKITKADKTASLDDGVVGEEVRLYVRPTDDGKWTATSVGFGPKTAAKASTTKK